MAASLKVSELSALSTLDAGDLLLVSDTSATTSKKVTFANVEVSTSLARLGTRSVNDLSDVHLVSNPANGNAFIYNAANSRWENSVPADPVQVDILQQLTGVANGNANFGGFTGNFLPSNLNLKAILQHVETAIENKATLLGTSVNDTSLGTFTGTTIADNASIKGVFQALETVVENKSTVLGTAINATNLGTFTGSVHSFSISDNLAVKPVLQEVEDAIEALEERLWQASLSTGFLYVDNFTVG